jgi:hemoglobin-like flavoprotein
MDADPITRSLITESLELVAERCGDPAPLVYERLFADAPQMAALFVRDADGAVRGQMLHQAIEAVLDFAGPGHYAANLIRSERINHEGLGVPPEVFARFLPTMREAFREIGGEGWTPAMDAAWDGLLAALETAAADA